MTQRSWRNVRRRWRWIAGGIAIKTILMVVGGTGLVREGDEVLLLAVCSVGPGRVLQAPNTQQEWVFDTPRGRFEVQSKLRDPVSALSKIGTRVFIF